MIDDHYLKGERMITNAELRIEAERLCDENAQLKDENTKLQKLVQIALKHCNAHNPMCDACCDINGGDCELEQGMCELGIKV